MSRSPLFLKYRLLRQWTLAMLLCSALFPCSMAAQSATANEDELRAAMVSHLQLFVEWPPAKTDPAHPHFHVCLLGADPIAPALEAAFRKTTTSNNPVVFSNVTPTDKLDACHLLYIGAGARGNFNHLLPALTQASVLTVSERPIDAAAGQVIGLPLEDNHVRIEVNLAAAQNSKLTVSSKLLRLAAVVRRP